VEGCILEVRQEGSGTANARQALGKSKQTTCLEAKSKGFKDYYACNQPNV